MVSPSAGSGQALSNHDVISIIYVHPSTSSGWQLGLFASASRFKM